jgi:hypothetical protein
MRKLSAAAATAVLLMSASSAFAETRTLDVPPFAGIEITSGIDASVSAGGAQSVVADAPNIGAFNDFKYEVRDGVLHVWYDWNIARIFDFSARELTLTIAVPSLDAIASTSGATVDATGIAGDRLKLMVTSGAQAAIKDATVRSYEGEVTSGAHLVLSGSCESARIEVTTGAQVEAKDLLCTDVVAETTTGAGLSITANGTIDAESTTGASMVVFGGPSVNHLESTTGGSISFPN